jgi:hypothetical protein
MTYSIPVIAAASTLLMLASPAGHLSASDIDKSTYLGGPCRASDSMTTEHLHYLRRFSIDTSPRAVAWRDGAKIPLITDTTSNVAVVSDSAACRSALVAYNALVTPDSAVTEIELLRADSVYVASNPSVLSGEFVGRHVFNHSFHYIGSYLK